MWAPQQGPLIPAHDKSFGVLSQAQGKVQPNPLLFLHRADSSLLLTHAMAGETQRGPQPLCTGGVQWGPNGSWCPSSTPTPR